MIGIRVDANKIISTGHAMRCIAIGQELQILGESVIFLVSDLSTRDFLMTKGYDCICLETDWRDKQTEVPILIKKIEENNIDRIIVDSYYVTKSYFEEISKWAKVIYIDDLNEEKYTLSMVVNYGVEISEKDYQNYKKEKAKLLLGRNYIPLRKEFRNQKISFKNYVTDVLITTGGSDNLCIIEKLIDQIHIKQDLSNVRFHIIIGGFFNNCERLKELTNSKENFILYYGVKDMSKVMLKCDVAISAGGTTLAELCALGIPTVCFAIADNQLSGVDAYEKNKVMLSSGDVRKDLNVAINDILNKTEKLIYDHDLRYKVYKNGQGFIDGNGAIRIAENIIEI